MGTVAHVLDDQQRRSIALEVDLFLELEREPDPSISRHSDLLAELADDRGLRILAPAPAATRKSPASRIAQLYEDQLAVRSKSDCMRSIGARPANVPARHHQLVSRGEREPKRRVEPGHIR